MKSEQDLDNYHTYMNRHNLTHFIPESEISKRNMKSSGLNAMGLLSGINQPITETSMSGKSNIIHAVTT